TRAVTIGHGDPGCEDRLNTLYYRVPVLNEEMPMAGTDKLTLMLDSSVVSAEQPGLYVEYWRATLRFARCTSQVKPKQEVSPTMKESRATKKPERNVWEPRDPNDPPLTPGSHEQLWQIVVKLPT